uniref:Ebe1 n=1 Tax=Arundo donax TaxID=35708 RepID=A0A0A9FWP0_ARUDO
MGSVWSLHIMTLYIYSHVPLKQYINSRYPICMFYYKEFIFYKENLIIKKEFIVVDKDETTLLIITLYNYLYVILR